MYREEIIKQEIANKNVLDIGSIGQTDEYRLWDLLAEHSDRLTGIDLPDAEDLINEHFAINIDTLPHKNDRRVVYGDMESYVFNSTFDVVIAGDVIEHVNNPGLFLTNIRKHITRDGKLIITTPNAKWPTVFMKPNPTHVLWHDRYTLATLLDRHGFKVTKIAYYPGNKPKYGLFKRMLAYHQAILVIAEPKNNVGLL